MSVNQMSCYHVAIEMYTIINNASSESLQRKMKIEPRGYNLRCLEDGKVRVPDKGKKSCTGFSYFGPKLWNHLPGHIRKTTIIDIFKDKLKEYIWEEIPSIWPAWEALGGHHRVGVHSSGGSVIFMRRGRHSSESGRKQKQNVLPQVRWPSELSCNHGEGWNWDS